MALPEHNSTHTYIVTMIPMRPRRICFERVCKRLSGLHSALRDTDGSIINPCSRLGHAMEVQRCSLVAQRVASLDYNGVADICLNHGYAGARLDTYPVIRLEHSRPLAIDANDRSRKSIGSSLHLSACISDLSTQQLTVTQPMLKSYVTVFAHTKPARAAKRSTRDISSQSERFLLVQKSG